MVEEKEIGTVSGYFNQVEVASIRLTAPLKVGQKIHIKGNTTDFITVVSEIQIERKPLKTAKKGDHIGIKVPEKARPNDKVYLVK